MDISASLRTKAKSVIETDLDETRRRTMTKLKVIILAAVATIALATPSLAQNFQGFGAPSSATQQQDNAPAQSKAVKLKTNQPR
jgi:hypothetical protein